MFENMKPLGRGNTAEVFEYGREQVCKLFFEGYPEEYAAREFKNAVEMYKSGARVPRPFRMISSGTRTGIIFERIEGETLLSAMSESVADTAALLDLFVKLQSGIHSHRAENVLSYKEYLSAVLQSRSIRDTAVSDAINALPDGECLLHGDLHPGNVLITADGKPVVIDFMNVCRGPALYDIARTYFLIKCADCSLAGAYLRKTGATENDIEKYLDIIGYTRQYES